MRIETIKGATPSVLAQKAAVALNEHLFAHKNGFCLLLSGGSALNILDSGLDVNLFNKNVTVGVLDERYSTDPKINNFDQLTQTSFYKKIVGMGAKFIDTRVRESGPTQKERNATRKETPEKLAERFDNALKNIKVPIIATVGVGADGHTSGMMPFPEDPKRFDELFKNTDRLVVSYDAAGKNQFSQRITTTLPLMSKISYAVGIVVGNEKQQALQKIADKNGTLAETPARILREMKDVDIFTNIE